MTVIHILNSIDYCKREHLKALHFFDSHPEELNVSVDTPHSPKWFLIHCTEYVETFELELKMREHRLNDIMNRK